MKLANIKSCLGLVVMGVVLMISGCMSIPNSPTPRLYALSSINEQEVSKKIQTTPDMIIGVGPVKIPEYLNRPQIVTKTPDKMLQLAQFDRWGESLDLGVARLIREDLTVMLPGATLTLYPWNPSMAVKYQVALEIVQLDSTLDKDMLFTVQWMIIDVGIAKTVIIKRSKFSQPIMPQNYSGLAKTLSAACASLSRQIAQELAALKIKDDTPRPKVLKPNTSS